MKLKATISLPGDHFTPEQRISLAEMVIATNSDELHDTVYQEVLKRYLHVGDFGPAEYFTQMSDRMTRVRKESNTIGFDVTLSGVSVTARRAQMDFWEALTELHKIYSNVAAEYLAPSLNAQIFSRMALDKAIDYLDRVGSTALLENGPTIIDGGGLYLIPETNDDIVLKSELEAILGDRRTLEDYLATRQVEAPSHRTNAEMGR